MSQLVNEDASLECDEIDFKSPDPSDSRRTYLLTYSKANMEKFPDCESFSKCVLQAFENGKSKSKVTQWATCIENHADGESKHFHMAVKLSSTRRWKSVFEQLRKSEGINVNFSSKHCGYVAAYRYVCKNKPIEQVLHSEGHSNLSSAGSSPRTKKAMAQFSFNTKRRRESCENADTPTSSKKAMKPKRLSNIDIAEFLTAHKIKSVTELMVIAKQRHDDGEKDMYSFILNKSPKALSELVSTTWRMHNAPKIVERSNKSRLDILKVHITDRECTEGCSGEWFNCAKEILRNNKINMYTFADAIRQCIIKGRQKRNNVMLVGPTNCGKSFLLDPLECIYKAFMNPSSTSYAWVGLDECEVAYLNDFRYTTDCIKWSDFLLILEGQTVNLPRPKNQFSTDLTISRENTIPFFATSKGPIEYVKYNVRDDVESEMMASRWNMFQFSNQITADKIKIVKPCPHCFANLVMQGSEMDD